MKKVLTIGMMLLAVLTGCSLRHDGIYQAENGWDIVDLGKTYEYRCEPDGFYLYIDWEGDISYGIDFEYNHEIYCKTVGRVRDYSCTKLNFLCKNKDGKYVYMANWSDFDGYLSSAKTITMNYNSRSISYEYKDIKPMLSLLEKYTSN